MGRHSRRGPAPKGDAADKSAVREGRSAPDGSSGPGQAGRPRQPSGPAPRRTPSPPPQQGPTQGYGTPPAYGTAGYGTPAGGAPRFPDGTPAHGVSGFPNGAPAHGAPRFPDGTPAGGAPRFPDGTPAHGVPRFSDGTPAHGVPSLPDGWLPDGAPAQGGVPRLPDGTPAHGFSRLPDGTPAHGVSRLPDGTPAHGVTQARGGHPEQREPGGGWGTSDGRTAAGAGYGVPAGPGASLPRQRQAPPGGPRQDYLDAFGEATDRFSPSPSASAPRTPDPYAAVTDWSAAPATGIPADPDDDDAPPTGQPAPAKGGKGRTFTGIAAAAVTTVLAVVVAGQVADERDSTGGVQTQATGEQARDVRDSASRGDDRETPSAPSAEPLTYEQKMDKKYPLSAARGGTGKFDAIPGIDKAPGKGQKVTYRVDVEQGLGLDGELFAEAVQKTLNDDRSWAHNGARTFERVHSGEVDFVITLAGPDTTADWCAKSGLDTTVDNVSCDSAATERVMINADRWAQGADTYGDEIHAYRQMLINHEIGHRLGFNHVTCDKDGDLAPVMQQQTKFLDHDGISCRPNAWAYPKS
ncbi:DUF3152 domain-containing protein [Streptomyces sp. CB02400]|uniref:DUF3152 domain-containing protein n=1 Tax=Streptomyces sp. CB02400 TaxID=1703944 RepID=UPI00093DA527|nr:DUF3152 domain-containing protein [Streptomyces sp. CB02400]OKK11607.1 hypothetical protein AMK33_09325 [Streptomyces sp. CB02400]